MSDAVTKLFDLSADTAVVIGGTGVLGGAMADALAAHGAKVAVLGRSEKRGQAKVQQIEAAGGTAMFHAVDALAPDSLVTARDAINAAFVAKFFSQIIIELRGLVGLNSNNLYCYIRPFPSQSCRWASRG